VSQVCESVVIGIILFMGLPTGQSWIYTVSKKNIPNVFSYKSRKHFRIFIIFGSNITEEVSNQKMLCFSTSPN